MWFDEIKENESFLAQVNVTHSISHCGPSPDNRLRLPHKMC